MHRPILFAALASLPALAAAQVQPGQWEVVTTTQSMEMAGVPPQVAAMMKGKPIRTSQCLTAEDAAKGPQEMMKRSKECRFTRYSMTGGKLDSVMVCSQSGSTTTATSTGSFTPTSFTATGSTVTTGGQAMTMKATTIGRLAGPCKK